MPTNHKKKKHNNTDYTSAILCIPDGEENNRILRERAEQIAKSVTNQFQQTSTANYISFYLGQIERYGIDYTFIKEVINNIPITKLPCAPLFIAGVINRRGALLAVLDLKQLIFNSSTSNTDINNIIIVSAHGITLGVIADKIENNRSYDPSALDPPIPSESLTNIEYISGLHHGQIAVLNIEKLISDVQLRLSNNAKNIKE